MEREVEKECPCKYMAELCPAAHKNSIDPKDRKHIKGSKRYMCCSEHLKIHVSIFLLKK